jgi:hypothetical protein
VLRAPTAALTLPLTAPIPSTSACGRGEQVGQGEGVVDAGVAVEVERVAGHGNGSRFGWDGVQRVSPLGAATKRLTMNAAAVMPTEIQSAVA